MPVDVYAWPPVTAQGGEWTVIDTIRLSRSMMTGKRYVSATDRRRREAALVVSGIGLDGSGAGYMEVLKRLLKGGEGLVRLYSTPIIWHLTDTQDDLRQSVRLIWTDGATQMNWTDGATEMRWYDGQFIAGTITTNGGWPAVALTGLPPNSIVARPGEFITAFDDTEEQTGETIMVQAMAVSDASGNATVRLLTAATNSFRFNLGTQETAVFEALSMPRAVQPVGANWFYEWSFREVFPDEVGGFTELNPWT